MVMRYLGGVNGPSYNPLASNVVSGNITVQQGGVYTVSSAAQNIPLGQWVDDPYFNQTVLLLQADNTPSGSQNNTFLDSSSNTFPIIRSGNATQGSFTPFTIPNGYWSNAFDGTGDYLTIAGNSNLAFGTDNFTIEMFVYLTGLNTGGAYGTLYSTNPTGTFGNYPDLYLQPPTGGVTPYALVWFLNNTEVIRGTTPLALGQWYHVAASRASGNLRLFLNGIQEGSTYVDSTSYLNPTGRPWIAGNAYHTVLTSITNIAGYISNVRVLKGTGLYAGNFIPPSAPFTPTAEANTQLLICQSNRFVDNSANGFTLTKFNDASVKPFSPFNSADTQYNSTTNMNSVFFPGLGNYAVTAQGAFGTTASTFTIEAWIYMTALPPAGNPGLVGDASPTGTTNNWTFGPVGTTNVLTFYWWTGATNYCRGTTTLTTNTWYHIAISVNANAISMYVNGTQETLTGTTTLTGRASTTNTISLGQAQNSAYYFTGYVSNLSILNGVAKYSGATITVPTAPLPTNAPGQVFLFAGQSGPSDSNTTVPAKSITFTGSVSGNERSPFGATSPQISPVTGGSVFLDGTGDLLSLNGPSALAFGTSAFSIEFFIYFTALDANNHIIYDSRPGADGAYPVIYVTNNGIIYYVNSGGRISTPAGSIVAGQWYHIVVSRVGTTTNMFVNGVALTPWTDTTNYLNGASRPFIGAAGSGIVGGYGCQGYISNLKVVVGSGVTSVTVPTAPLTVTAGTQLLLSGTNAGIYDATSTSAIETVGNAQVSTAIEKYGSGSMYFDGTGDWLVIPDNIDLRLGTGDFTIEAWVNIPNYAASITICSKGTSTTGWVWYIATTTGRLAFGYGVLTLNGVVQIPANTWTHVALVRNGSSPANNVKMYVNGFLDVASTSAITTDFNQTENLVVGANRPTANPFIGYIDDLRITKGVARYLTNFVPPTVALPRVG